MVSLRTALRVMPAFWFALPIVLLAPPTKPVGIHPVGSCSQWA